MRPDEKPESSYLIQFEFLPKSHSFSKENTERDYFEQTKI